MHPFLPALVSLSAIGCGLMAGLFFVFSNTIMSALDRLPAAQAIAAMQSINTVILNRIFLGLFFGTALLSLAVLATGLWRWPDAGSAALAGGALAYLLGGLGVTVVRNVPLNRSLEAMSPVAPESARGWMDYRKRWTAWNHVRTLACLIASAAQIASLPALGAVS